MALGISDVLLVFLAGFLGGMIRGIVGITKYINSTPTRRRKVRKDWVVLSLASSGGMGLLAGCLVADDIKFALVAGYAGTDFIESLFKIKMKTRTWE